MQRAQLETALRAAAQVTGEREFILVGSQAVHAHSDAAPAEVVVSIECDLWAKDRFEKLVAVEDPLGKRSRFAEENGFYVDPIEPNLLLLPTGWETRLKKLEVPPVIAWCLDVNDLVIS